MSQMNIEYINPFITAATSVLQTACSLQLTSGKPYVKTTSFSEDSLVICIGITGQLGGQVLLACSNSVACEIASRMCMMQMDTLDDLAMSALSELGNMVLGNAATLLSNKDVIIDITPPIIIKGNFVMERTYARNICIPMNFDGDKLIEFDVSITEEPKKC